MRRGVSLRTPSCTTTKYNIHLCIGTLSYKGFHDVCSVVLLKFGPTRSPALINRLARSHLAVYLEKDLLSTIKFLDFIYVILQAENPILYSWLGEKHLSNMCLVSAVISWFSSDLEDVEVSKRLFDFLVIMPPATIGYLSVCVLERIDTAKLEKVEHGHIHQYIKHELPNTVLRHDTTGELFRRTYDLMIKYPPSKHLSLELKDTVLNRDLFTQTSEEFTLFYWAVIPLLLALIWTHKDQLRRWIN